MELLAIIASMSLGLVEIILLWEDSLEVTIEERAAADLLTTRRVTHYFAERLGATGQRGACLSMRAFHRVRHALGKGTGLARKSLRPDTRLSDLLPFIGRRDTWAAVREASGFAKLPGPGWVRSLLFSTPATVGELAEWIVANPPRALKSPQEAWTRSEIRDVVRGCVREISGLRGFSDDDEFVRDLGLS